MSLVDRQRLAVRVAARPGLEPLFVAPGIGRVEDDRCRGGWTLGEEGDRVCLLPPDSVPAEDLVFVPCASADLRHEELPDTAVAHRAHRVSPAFPLIEVTDAAYPP